MAVTMLKSPKKINADVAHLPEVKRALKAAADVKAAAARGVLAAHRDTGNSKITVTHGKLDYYVNLDDSRGANAAAAIEFGHIARNGRFVPGIHALTGGM